MNRRELTLAVMDSQTDSLSSAACGRTVALVLDKITDALSAGQKLSLVGFATLEVVGRKGRTVRNPQSGAMMDISPSKGVRFRLSPKLKARINGR